MRQLQGNLPKACCRTPREVDEADVVHSYFFSKGQYVIQSTKTNAGKRQIPITEAVARCFQAIIENKGKPKKEQFVDGYCGFLYFDENGMPLVALHWEHRFQRMVKKYNEIYRIQMPNITPHICRHTYCSNQAKAGMNPKTLQYLMGHSEISVTIPVPNSNTKNHSSTYRHT